MAGVIIFILILSFLVLIHELGHFIAARRAGVTVHEFGLGYPPKAVKLFTWQGTDFTLNYIPFGGFVRLAGEDLTPDEKLKAKKSDTEPGQFFQASVFSKLMIILAGATVNLIFGILAFSIVFSSMGIPEPIETARIGLVAPESPAAAAGIPEQVEIIALVVDDQTYQITTTEQAVDTIAEHRGNTVQIVTTGNCEGYACQESAQTFEVYLRTEAETPEGQGSLGIAFDPVAFVHYPWWQMPFKSSWYGMQQAVFLGQEILMALGRLGQDVSSGQVPEDLAGPVGIVHQASSAGILAQGWLMLLSFAGMLSVNLAIMNVLPIPPLDGGRAVLIVLEKIIAKKTVARIEYYLNYGGYLLLVSLIIFVTIQDVVRIVK